MPKFRLDSPLADPMWICPPVSPVLMLRCESPHGPVRLTDAAGQLLWQSVNPLDGLRYLDQHLAAHRATPGRWIGYLSYDLGRWFENLPATAQDDLSLPLYALGFCPDVPSGNTTELSAANQPKTTQVQADATDQTPAYPSPQKPAVDGARHDELSRHDGSTRHAELSRHEDLSPHEPDSPVPPAPLNPDARLACNFTPAGYEEAVARAIEYIREGDIFQVNLSQRFSVPFDPARCGDVYRRLQSHTPADYAAWLNLDDFHLLSNSPELFLAVDPTPDGRRIIRTRPIKGTRPRLPGMDTILRDSVKDAAELNMIIDLQRNDLGRVCSIGSVVVSQPRTIEVHPTVYHGVATVQGQLRADTGILEILAATFPGGSITGAPKIRSMEIIESLEKIRRGPYCGAIGCLHTSGHIRLNIAIRTLVAVRDRAIFSVGGGIVSDSIPNEEYEETITKSQAMFLALGLIDAKCGSNP